MNNNSQYHFTIAAITTPEDKNNACWFRDGSTPHIQNTAVKKQLKGNNLILTYVDDYGVFKSKTFSFNRRNHHEKENYLYILILIGLQTYLKMHLQMNSIPPFWWVNLQKEIFLVSIRMDKFQRANNLRTSMLIRFGKDSLTSMLKIMVSKSALRKVMSLSSV